MLSLASFVTLAAGAAYFTRAQAGNPVTVTKVRENGRSAWTFLVDDSGGVLGQVTVVEDQIAGTFYPHFGYVADHPTDPDLALLLLGDGYIEASAVTIDQTSAHLAVTTPDTPSFYMRECIRVIFTQEFTCDRTSPVTFDLTWTSDGAQVVHQQTTRTETFGPDTMKVDGEYVLTSASAAGTWSGPTGAFGAEYLFGYLTDSENKTLYREVTVTMK